MDVLDHETLSRSVESRIAGQQRLNRLRLGVRLGRGKGAEGIPQLVIMSATGETLVTAPSISFDDLVGACDAFNAWIATGRPADVEDPTTVRRRKNEVATAIGNHVRDLLLADGL